MDQTEVTSDAVESSGEPSGGHASAPIGDGSAVGELGVRTDGVERVAEIDPAGDAEKIGDETIKRFGSSGAVDDAAPSPAASIVDDPLTEPDPADAPPAADGVARILPEGCHEVSVPVILGPVSGYTPTSVNASLSLAAAEALNRLVNGYAAQGRPVDHARAVDLLLSSLLN